MSLYPFPWHEVIDDRGDTCHVVVEPCLTRKPAFKDGDPVAMAGYVMLPDGDTYRAWWPVFTEWFVDPV